MATYNVEMRERVSNAFSNLMYPRTHVTMVDGLLDSNGAFKLSLIPNALFGDAKSAGAIGVDQGTSATLLGVMDDYITTLLGGVSATIAEKLNLLRGMFITVIGTGTLTVSTNHSFYPSDDGVTTASPGATITFETGDRIIVNTATSSTTIADAVVSFGVINNTTNLATQSASGLFSSTDKTKLDGIAAGANAYTHPAYTARSIDADGVEVIDVATFDATGHVTAFSKRTLPNVTQSVPGVMTATDKTKLDGIAASANNYVHPNSFTSRAIDTTGMEVIDVLTVGTDGHVSNASKRTLAEVTTTTPGVMGYSDKVKLNGIAAGANAYTHPSYTAIANLNLAANETMLAFTVDAAGHVTAGTKQTIRTGSTSQTGILQLATGTELTTSLSSAKPAAASAVKSMIDYFGGLKRYADLTTADAAVVADGSFALITVTA